MATKLYIRFADSDWSSGNNDARLDGTAVGWQPGSLSTSKGSSSGSGSVATVAGPTSGVEFNTGVSTINRMWISPPLAAAVTISGSITWNLWASESNMSANVSIEGRIERIDGATGAFTTIDTTAHAVELPVTTRAAQNFAHTPAAGVACKKGDRLRVRVFGDDVGATNMGTGFTFDFSADGPTDNVDGDSYLTLTETISFASEPAGTTIYPTDTASDVSTASVDREAWTSRGAGVQNDVTNTAAGWTAPIQVTDTAGGTVVDWFTRALAAFTVGGAVRVNVRAKVSATTGNPAVRCEVARVAGDGTGATVWAAATNYGGGGVWGTTETAFSFLISGDDLAVSDGQRLRIRLSIDDSGNFAMGASQTVTTYYAGTSGGASGDTYLTFTQTLTESAAANPPYTNPYPPLLAQ